MAAGQEQDRSEEATPFKLQRAREKGQVARSIELGVFGALVSLIVFILIAGEGFAGKMAQLMRVSLSAGIDQANDPERAAGMLGALYWSALQPVILLGVTIMLVVLLLEIVQLRGFLFSTHPLKPDFTRLNPAQGLKRLFSARMFKETLKNLLKAAIYGTATYLTIRHAVASQALIASDGERLAEIFRATGLRLLFVFAGIAFGFVLLDQIMVRREFGKQMRMSRREVTREAKEREGEPRIKRKRKQLHAEFSKQGSGELRGADMLVVNPDHYAVALRYDNQRMTAPTVAIKGRNARALALKDQAFRLAIPIMQSPALARALYRQCDVGAEIGGTHYEKVADLYLQLHRARQHPSQD
ncbi:EscU/YscU/HrcU family type III secretion system export apparatus switch protein [Sphingomonas gilva]|uniref:EscU/YscU/HrcU family type III secretion system export apparatus switch protein n=1 Tax=Sphingomonas gilva TaxID=2305907 RepID=A0A396RQP8_9SPHN|nr:EscU/YscU/HrcU family type III secretion system export apparatus switch protein [Sphingomonas gilva]RHW18947.1 EscU/YscU/HrcU family type III secretion system export apparatus switch protein [Sphingomonas gilva]